MAVRQSEGIRSLPGTWVSVIPEVMHNRFVLLWRLLLCRSLHSGEEIPMEAKLYVGNLPFSTTDADLQGLFAQAGTVKSAQVIKDRASGRSKGFGFVEMGSADEAQNAISMFHSKDFGGRALTVNIARPREERPAGFRGGDRNRERRGDY